MISKEDYKDVKGSMGKGMAKSVKRATDDSVGFKPLQYHEYSKLSSKAKETYNKGEREYNFNRKMERKYGSSSKSRAIKKLGKMFN